MAHAQKIPCALLHAHSGYSVYDGMGTPKQRALRAKELGHTHLALTDHGVMNGIVEHYFACKDLEIEPILGIEAYQAVEYMPDPSMGRYHLTLLAKDLEGYYSLCQASTEAWVEKHYYKPIMDFETLRRYSKNVICMSGCVLGLLSQTLLNGTFDEACRHTETFLDIYGENFFFEVQPQEFDAQFQANEGILKLADKFGRPVVMTSDSHYSSPDDLETYLQLRKMNFHPPAPKKPKKGDTTPIEVEDLKDTDDMFQIKLDEFEEGIRKQYGKLYLPSGEELASRWNAFMQRTDGATLVAASQVVADQCHVVLEFPEMVPKAIEEVDPITLEPVSSDRVLAKMVQEGLKRLKKWYLHHPDGSIQLSPQGKPLINRVYYKRVQDELAIIVSKHYADYFLLCADLMREARARNIATGPGRGSGGGSMVAAAIGILEIDPVEQGCAFQRFLHEARTSLPDFDMDFDPNRRWELFEYLENKYAGKGAMICNINRLSMASLVNDLGRVMHVDKADIAKLKAILSAIGFGKIKDLQPEESKLLFHKELRALNFRYPGIITHFCKLYGSPRSMSEHASGFAISAEKLSKFVPLFVRGSKGKRKVYTAYDMNSLAYLNVVKIDVLGLSNATALQKMCELTGVDYHTIPLDDPLVFQAYCEGNVEGSFQFESQGAQAILRAVQPENLQELIACTALNRPGSGPEEVAIYVKGKQGKVNKNDLYYQCCDDAYGAVIYDEHKMQICRRIAGLDWKTTMKIIKQNHSLNTAELKDAFIKGVKQTSNFTEQAAQELYHKVLSYSFNKGHATPYTTLSYWLMWMKVHYPFEFFLATLQLEGVEQNRKRYEADAFHNNVPVFPPHVNGARGYAFVTIQNNDGVRERAIRAGLLSLDGVGPIAAAAIEAEWRRNGDFLSEEDLLRRVNGVDKITKGRGDKKVEVELVRGTPVNSRVLEALSNAGALEFDLTVYKKKSAQRLAGYLSYNTQRRSA